MRDEGEKMEQTMKKMESSRWWWFDSHKNASKRSPWLQSTLSELDTKTKAMLKLIEEDADSFAQRAEMYYKKRPELISLVEDLYRAHRSLAERYDQVKTDPGSRLLGSPFPSMKYNSEKTINVTDNKTYDSYSESTFGFEDYAESEIDDPNHERDAMDETSSEASEDETRRLKEEIERLKEENEIQKAELMQKDEEKIEVIRQLSLAVQVVKEENMELKKTAVKQSHTGGKWSPLEYFSRSKGGFLGLFLNGSPKFNANAIELSSFRFRSSLSSEKKKNLPKSSDGEKPRMKYRYNKTSSTYIYI